MKTSAWIVTSVVSLGAIAGISTAVVQTHQTSISPNPTSATALPATSTNREIASPAPAPASPSPTELAQSPAPSPSGTVERRVESCLVRMARVNDPEPPLNVRSQPSTTEGQIVGQVKNGTYVTVVQEQDGWFQIEIPIKGWISKARTDSGCNQKVEQVKFPATGGRVEIRDRFIGTGNHVYRIAVQAGQTLTVTRQQGPFPVISAPDRTPLAGTDSNEERPRWSGKLTQGGNYTIELQSNFRGYQYGFAIELQ